MSYDYLLSTSGEVGTAVSLPWVTVLTNLDLADLSSLVVVVDGAQVVDPVTDLTLQLVEVDSVGLPGWYTLTFIPATAGLHTIRFVYDTKVYQYTVEVAAVEVHEPPLADVSLYGETEIIVTDDSAIPIEGVMVSRYSNSGTQLLEVKYTPESGRVLFTGIEAGTYQYRLEKTGYTFTDSPFTVETLPIAESDPIITELLPTSASIGDRIAIRGQFFDVTDSEVLFGTTTVAAESVSPDGKVLVVTVPAGLTNLIVPIRVQKPDPNNLPSGKLISESVNLERIP